MDLPSDLISAGQAALAIANCLEAEERFESALHELDSPEVHDGLGLALWRLNDISASHEQRTLAYHAYKAKMY